MESKEGTLIQTSLYWRERSEKAEQQIATLQDRIDDGQEMYLALNEQIAMLAKERDTFSEAMKTFARDFAEATDKIATLTEALKRLNDLQVYWTTDSGLVQMPAEKQQQYQEFGWLSRRETKPIIEAALAAVRGER